MCGQLLLVAGEVPKMHEAPVTGDYGQHHLEGGKGERERGGEEGAD